MNHSKWKKTAGAAGSYLTAVDWRGCHYPLFVDAFHFFEEQGSVDADTGAVDSRGAHSKLLQDGVFEISSVKSHREQFFYHGQLHGDHDSVFLNGGVCHHEDTVSFRGRSF
jgi:hypothetical protein